MATPKRMNPRSIRVRTRRRFRLIPELLESRELLSTTWTVTSTFDTFNGDGTPTNGTLRWAVAGADKATGDNIIDFSVTGTITLSGTQLELKNTSGDKTQTIEITGAGANLLSVSGNAMGNRGTNDSRVFLIDGGVTASISGLTITEGTALTGQYPQTNLGDGYGGGVENAGTLTMTGCTLSSNFASAGGGVQNERGGTLSMTGCTLSGNYAFDNGGGGVDNRGTLTMTGCTSSHNFARWHRRRRRQLQHRDDHRLHLLGRRLCL